MLAWFRTVNHRSLLADTTLDLRAVDNPRVLLPVAGIFGANGSGKTTVLHALSFMSEVVDRSYRNWGPEDPIARHPFALTAAGRALPSTYEVGLRLDGRALSYGFDLDGERILGEWLVEARDDDERVLFERTGQDYDFGGLSGENAQITRLTRPNALYLSTAAQTGHPELAPLHRWFAQRVHPIGSGLGRPARPHDGARLLHHEAGDRRFRTTALDLLRSADIGIADVVSEPERAWLPAEARYPVRFLHAGSDSTGLLPLEAESWGTQAFLGYLPVVLRALDEGGVVLADELDASLHPAVLRELVSMFQDPARNPHGAQLLFDTHDTSLLGDQLGDPVLGRDQIWFAEKAGDGTTNLYPFSDYPAVEPPFGPDLPEDLQRSYLHGRFGAVPRVGYFDPTPNEEE